MEEAEGAGAHGGAVADGPAEMEVLALVCPDQMLATGPAVMGHGPGAGEQAHENELQARRESLKFVLSRTVKNLEYFNEQCKSNPSCEVPAPFHPPPT